MTDKSEKTLEHLPSEAVVRHQWDRCFANTVVKSSLGAFVGVVLSTVLFKCARRMQRVLGSPVSPLRLGDADCAHHGI